MSLALFGGSFDPPHIGHLQSAQELLAKLNCDQLALLPAAHSPLKPVHSASADNRLKMLELAVHECGDCDGKLVIDYREIRRAGRSYSIDTLREIRAEIGSEKPLFWVVGSDSVQLLEKWKEWAQLLDYCHLVVIERAGAPTLCSPIIQAWLDCHRCYKLETLQTNPAGSVFFCTLSQLLISSTAVREKIVNGAPLTGWLPTAVAEYIEHHSLYR